MNIGIDIRSLSERYYAGVPSYTLRLLEALFSEDKKNHYFLFENAWKKSPNAPRFSGNNIHTVSLRIPNKLFHACLFFFRRPRLDRLIEKKAGVKLDLFFLPNWHFSAFSRNCKVVLTVHDLAADLFPEFFSLKMRLWHALLNPKKLCRKADRVIAVSEHTKNDLFGRYGIAPERTVAIHSGIAPRPTNEETETAVLKKYGMKKPFIFFLGTLEPRKNIIGIVDAFEKLTALYGIEDMELALAGAKGWLYKNIGERIARSPCASRIRTLSYITEEEKWALCRAASIFVYPSFYEGFGLPILEAMSAGAPVITSHTSCLPEIADNAALLVDPYHTRAIAEAMAMLLRDPALRDTFKKRGMERTKTFTWSKTAQQTLRIFERLGNASSEPSSFHNISQK